MILYISGPMSNIEHHNQPAFHNAAAVLRTLGHAPLNPATYFGGRVDLDRADNLRRDLVALCSAEGVVVLSGWTTSKGSCMEVLVAQELGLPVFEFGKVWASNGVLHALPQNKVVVVARDKDLGDRIVPEGGEVSRSWTTTLPS